MGKITLDADDIGRRYLAGMSEKALAISLGVDRRVIRRHLLSAGIKPRGRSDAMYVRMAGLTFEQRQDLARAANESLRGTAHSFEHQSRVAARNAVVLANVSVYEDLLAEGLAERGVDFTKQQACGPYNIDLAIGSVAVEVLGGCWHRSKSHGDRVRYLLDHGYDVLYIWSTSNYQIDKATAEHVVAFAESTSRTPSSGRRYRVIRGNGKFLAEFRNHVDEIPDMVPFSDRPEYEPDSVPYGFCRCGCGGKTNLAKSAVRGHIVGEPLTYISGHNNPRRPR